MKVVPTLVHIHKIYDLYQRTKFGTLDVGQAATALFARQNISYFSDRPQIERRLNSDPSESLSFNASEMPLI